MEETRVGGSGQRTAESLRKEANPYMAGYDDILKEGIKYSQNREEANSSYGGSRGSVSPGSKACLIISHYLASSYVDLGRELVEELEAATRVIGVSRQKFLAPS